MKPVCEPQSYLRQPAHLAVDGAGLVGFRRRGARQLAALGSQLRLAPLVLLVILLVFQVAVALALLALGLLQPVARVYRLDSRVMKGLSYL